MGNEKTIKDMGYEMNRDLLKLKACQVRLSPTSSG